MSEISEALKPKVEELKNSIVSSIKSRIKDFLDENKDAEEFLKDRAERLAKLTVQYAIATDDAAKAAIKGDMEIVRQTIENEASAVAVKASKASKDLFKAVLGTAFDALVKVLPTLVSLI